MSKHRRWMVTAAAILVGAPLLYTLLLWSEVLPLLSEKDLDNVELMRSRPQPAPIESNAFFDLWMLDYDLDAQTFEHLAEGEVQRVNAAVLNGVEDVDAFSGPTNLQDGLDDAHMATLCPDDETCLGHVAFKPGDVADLLDARGRYLDRVTTALSKTSLSIPFIARLNTPVPSNVVGTSIRYVRTELAFQFLFGEREQAIDGACRLGEQLRSWRKNSNSLQLSTAVDHEIRESMFLYIDMLRRTPISEPTSKSCRAWASLGRDEYRQCDIWRKEFEWVAEAADVASSPSLRGKTAAQLILSLSTNKRHTEAQFARAFAPLCNANVSSSAGEQYMTGVELGFAAGCSRWERIFNPTGCGLVDKASGMTLSKLFNRSFDLDAQLTLTRFVEARFLDTGDTLDEPELRRIGMPSNYPPSLSQILRAVQIPVHSDNSNWFLPIDRVSVSSEKSLTSDG